MTVIKFVNSSDNKTTLNGHTEDKTITNITSYVGELRYGVSTNLPEALDKRVLFFTTDTGELYQGTGNGIKKIITGVINPGDVVVEANNSIIIDKKENFPETGEEQKLYIDKENGTIYFWLDGDYKMASAGASSEKGGSVIKAGGETVEADAADGSIDFVSDSIQMVTENNKIHLDIVEIDGGEF